MPLASGGLHGSISTIFLIEPFQELITQARATTDTAERAALYEKALAILHDEVVWIDQAHPKMFTAMRKNVEGYTQSPLTTNNFATTQVK